MSRTAKMYFSFGVENDIVIVKPFAYINPIEKYIESFNWRNQGYS